MPLGSTTPTRAVNPTPAAGNEEPALTTRALNAASFLDTLTGREVGVKCWSTGSFTGSAEGTFNGLKVSPIGRLRIRKVVFYLSPDAAVSGGATVSVLQLRQNMLTTGIECLLYVPVSSVQATPGVIGFAIDLGDGWVGEKGHGIGVIASAVLTTGQYRVLLFGNEEAAD